MGYLTTTRIFGVAILSHVIQNWNLLAIVVASRKLGIVIPISNNMHERSPTTERKVIVYVFIICISQLFICPGNHVRFLNHINRLQSIQRTQTMLFRKMMIVCKFNKLDLQVVVSQCR